MSTTSIFDAAELSLASYADLTNGTPDATALQQEGNGLAPVQADAFASQYTVIAQVNQTATSFSATVFRDGANNLTLAIRGTAELSDLIGADSQIAVYGAAYHQIVAMYNWWQVVSNPAGIEVAQFSVVEFAVDGNGADGAPEGALRLYTSGNDNVGNFRTYLVSEPTATSTGELADEIANDTDHNLEITGHSLGGHLALAFNTLFSGDAGQVTVFNAPGFLDGATNQAFFQALGGSVPTPLNSSSVINVVADQSSDVGEPFTGIAGLHSRPGIAVDIAIEDQYGLDSDEPESAVPAFNHSQMILTDSLAVYELLAGLDPALDATDYRSILNSAALGTSGSYERVVDVLDSLFGINDDLLPTGNDARNDLYTAIYQIQADADYASAVGQAHLTPLHVESLKDLESSMLQSIAATDIAYRYALVHLNPFALTGDESLYASHNANGELELYDEVTGAGTLTAEYLAASLLSCFPEFSLRE